MAAQDPVNTQREAEVHFLESIKDVQKYLDIKQHPHERSKVIYDCIRHFNEKKENILFTDDELQQALNFTIDEKGLVTVYDYVGSAFVGPRRDKKSLEEARKAWEKDLPGGHKIMETRSALNDHEKKANPNMSEERKTHQCGLFALIESIKSQFPNLTPPDIIQLHGILDRPELKSLLAVVQSGGVSIDKDYTEDTVDAVLLNWGKTIVPEQNLRLGCIVDGGDPYFVNPEGAKEPNTRFLWVHNSTADNHWEGLEAKTQTELAAKPETQKEAKSKAITDTKLTENPEVGSEVKSAGKAAELDTQQGKTPDPDLEASTGAKPKAGPQVGSTPEVKDAELGAKLEASLDTQPGKQPDPDLEVSTEAIAAKPKAEPEVDPEANPTIRAINSSTDLQTELGWPFEIEDEITFRKDPTCRFIFLEKVSSTLDFININETMLLEILSYHQVSPCYLSLISSFRSQTLTEAADLFFGGFRSRKSFTSKTTPIDKLGRSGHQFHLAFKLKAFSKPSEDGFTKHTRAEEISEKEMAEKVEVSEAKGHSTAEPEEVPAQDVPAKAMPEEGGPAKEAPAKEAPAKEAPAKEAPAKEAPAKEAPAKEAPAKEAPAKEAPAKEAPAKEAPAKEAPAKAEPEEGGQANEATGKAELEEGALANGSLAKSNPVKENLAKIPPEIPAKGDSAEKGLVEGGSGATKLKPRELAEPDWSVYEAAVYQCFDLKNGRVLWLITAPQREAPESPSNVRDPWGNIVDVHKEWPKISGSRPEDCLRASFSALEWLSEWSLSEFGFYAALLDEKLRILTDPYFIGEAPEEIDEIQLKIMNNNMERLANCIVMLENNIKVFKAINKFFTEELKSGGVSSEIERWLNACEHDVLQFGNHMTEIEEVAKAIVDRAKLLMERALRREAGIQKLLQNRNDETIKTLTEQTQTDSTRMSIFAFITLVLLPVTVVSTVFATDIVRFQEPTPIVLDGTGATESSKPQSSEINTFHGKFSRWALMWWSIWCIIVTSIVLIGSFCFMRRAQENHSSQRRTSAYRPNREAPPSKKSASKSIVSPEGSSTSLSKDDVGSLRHRPKRQGAGGDGSKKDSEKATDQDMGPSTRNSSETKIDSTTKADSSANTADSKTKLDEKNSKASGDEQNWNDPTVGTKEQNLEHSTSESANFQVASALEKGQKKVEASTLLHKLRAYAGLGMKKRTD